RGFSRRWPNFHHAFAGDVVAEDLDVARVPGPAVSHGVLEHRLAVRVQAVLLDRERVLDLERDGVRGRPLLGQRDGLVTAVDAGPGVPRAGFDSRVEPRD